MRVAIPGSWRLRVAPALVATAIAGACAAAWSQTTPGPTILARESDTCGTWQRDQNEARRFWVFGYLSGLNTARGGVYHAPSDALRHIVDPEEVVSWIGKYCKQHPQHTLQHAADKLLLELSTK